jgi:tetratricopeptide (TPR) repeat protein
MTFSASGKLALASLAAAFALGCSLPALADDEPRIDCTKKANKDKPACQNKRGMIDEELYNAAYWLNRDGKYAEALTLLKQISDGRDYRVLTAQGFATRKLGDVDAALPFYMQALALNPAATRTREYLGEAYLTKGDVGRARGQLDEIANRCGTTCDGYAKLAAAIAQFQATGKIPS